MKIDYFLNGVVNGQYLEVRGNGRFEEKGGFTLDLHSINAPQGWDPGIILLICCGNSNFYSAKLAENSLIEDKNELTPLKLGGIVGRRGFIQDGEGNEVTALHAKGFLTREGDTIYSRSIILDGYTRLGDYGGIKSIDNFFEEISPSQKFHATGLANFAITMNNGVVLKGSSLYPYIFENFDLKDKIKLHISDLNSGYDEFIASGRKRTTISATVAEFIPSNSLIEELNLY